MTINREQPDRSFTVILAIGKYKAEDRSYRLDISKMWGTELAFYTKEETLRPNESLWR